MRAFLPLTLLSMACLLAAREARACGGFFCNTPTPVDQTAEQIVFSQEGGKGVARVQIRFTGSAPDFGWIVPVRQAPEKVEVDDLSLFTELQRLTAPQFVLPQSAASTGTGCDPSCGTMVAMSSDAKSSGEGGVDVLGTGTVGPYDWVAVRSTASTELLKWLSDRRYNVSSEAASIVQRYLDEGFLFVALKLVPGADVSQLAPVKFTFPVFEPCVPLRLTAVSARPDMGVLVYVLAEHRATPERFAHVEVDFAKVRFSFDGTDPTNYRRLLGQVIDDAGGRGFTTEYAGRTSALLPQATGDATRRLLMGARYVTRLYGVLSADEMTADPLFPVDQDDDRGDVSNVHELGSDALSGASGFLPWTLAALGLRRRRRT
ncbi:MAG: hypothetical protein RL199_836 [Pseudomonadota bacterium]|jgi:hypothetical protein